MHIKSKQNRFNQCQRWLSFVSVGVLLSACQPTTNVESNVKFTPPDRILQARAINRDMLSPSVLLADGTRIPMRSTGNNTWGGTINVQPNNTYLVSIEWIEALPEGNLVLAQSSQSVDVDEDGAEIQFSEENYDYNLDFDNDQVSNIDERINETNPFVNNDQPDGNTTAGATDGEPSSSETTTETTSGTTAGSTTDSGADDVGLDTENTSTTTAGTGASDGVTTDGGTTDDGDTTAGTDGGTTDDSDTTAGTDGDDSPPRIQPTVLIPRISASDAPAIDGLDVLMNGQGELRGEWRGAVQFDNFGDGLWIKNLMIDRGADGQDGAELRQWAAMHDGVNLYVLVLSDDLGARHSDSIDFWEDDSLELFIDGDNSKLREWGDDDDFQMIIPLLQQFSDDEPNNEFTGRFSPGPFSDALQLEFSTGIGIGPDGIRAANWEQDVYELSIPIASAGITIGSPFGFEMQLNDDDNGGFRDSKWGWFHPSRIADDDTDLTYQDPSIMGTVVLQQ